MAVRRGDTGAVEEALLIIQDEAADLSERLQYIGVFGEVKHRGAVPVLLGLVRDTNSAALCKAAVSALLVYDDPVIGDELVQGLARFSDDIQMIALDLLSSRPSWAGRLLQAIESGSVAAVSVPPEAVRKIRQYENLSPSASRIFGQAELVDAGEAKSLIERLTGVIQSGSGDPFAGSAHYQLACSTCHTLFGEGGQIGPDLTSYRRDDLETLLLHIVSPSAEIREGYENLLVQTTDGRTLSGFLADKDNQVLVLRGLDGGNTIIPRAQVAETRAAGSSLMPEGLLDGFNEQQLRDLFAYLRSTQPLVKR